jgi:hypothetical protein
MSATSFANIEGSSSGRQLYMQYGMIYMHQCEQSGEQKSVFETHGVLVWAVWWAEVFETHGVLVWAVWWVGVCSRPTGFETRSRHQKLNVNLENCAFHCFVLYKQACQG